MKRFVILACAAAFGLSATGDTQAQILRRRCSTGCGTARGCNVSSSGCNASAAGGCSLAPALPASVTVPAQLPPTADLPPAPAPAVERLLRRAAGCENGTCRIEPLLTPRNVPLAERQPLAVDARRAMAFCTLSGTAAGGPKQRPPFAAPRVAADPSANLIAAFR